jgi:hypothetical protein
VRTWRRRAARLLHDVASRTIASAFVATLAAVLTTGGTLYWWRREVARWFGDSTYVANWLIAIVVAIVACLMAAAVVLAVKLRALRQRDYLLSPPWVIRDTGFGLEWRLRRRPASWSHDDLDLTAPGHIESLIQGPFHGRRLPSGELCLELLVMQTDDGAQVPTTCPRCGASIYDDSKGWWDPTWLKRRTLKGIRRDDQLGKPIKSGYAGDFILPYVAD